MATQHDLPVTNKPTRRLWLGAILSAFVGAIGAAFIVRSLGGLVDNAMIGAMQGLTSWLVYLTNLQLNPKQAALSPRQVKLSLGFILVFYLIVLVILCVFQVRSGRPGLNGWVSSWIGFIGSSLGGLIVPLGYMWRRQRA